MLDGEEIVETFMGSIDADTEHYALPESNEYDFGAVISDDKIDMAYLGHRKPQLLPLINSIGCKTISLTQN